MMEKQDISAGVDKNLTKKLHVTDFIRMFAAKFGKVTSIMLPFDSRKSRKFPRISQWLASDAHTYMAWGRSCCFVDSGCARTYVDKMAKSVPAPSLSSHCHHAHGGHGSEQPSCQKHKNL